MAMSGHLPTRARSQQMLADRPALRLLGLPLRVLIPVLAPLTALSHAVRRLCDTAHKPLTYTDFYGRSYRTVARGRFDVFHAHDLNTLPAAALLARHTGARLGYDSHELYPEVSTLSGLERATWRALEPRLIHRADLVLTVCDSIADELSRRYAIARPAVLLNCPEASETPDAATSLLRAAAGLGDDRETPLVLYQGGFAPNRGLPELIAAMHEITGAVLVLMGWGRLEAELAALIRRARLEQRVRMLEPVPRRDLVHWTAGADVGVIPYQPIGLNNTYSTPNKLFEYLAAGVPIAATRLPEIARIVDGHRIGATFARVRPEEIAATINGLLSDPAALRQMREREAAIRSRYTWEHESAKLTALYDELGSSRRLNRVGLAPGDRRRVRRQPHEHLLELGHRGPQ